MPSETPNHCKCGCGRVIPWKTATGFPREFAVGHAHRFRHIQQPTPLGHLAPEEIEALTPETIQAITDALLYGLARRTEKQGRQRKPEWTKMVCDEVRRRGMEQALHFVNMLDPPACAEMTAKGVCGKPGHYIVNRTTYCREHAMTVGVARRTQYGARQEAQGAERQMRFDDREYARKRAEARRRFTNAARGRRK